MSDINSDRKNQNTCNHFRFSLLQKTFSLSFFELLSSWFEISFWKFDQKQKLIRFFPISISLHRFVCFSLRPNEARTPSKVFRRCLKAEYILLIAKSNIDMPFDVFIDSRKTKASQSLRIGRKQWKLQANSIEIFASTIAVQYITSSSDFRYLKFKHYLPENLLRLRAP